MRCLFDKCEVFSINVMSFLFLKQNPRPPSAPSNFRGARGTAGGESERRGARGTAGGNMPSERDLAQGRGQQVPVRRLMGKRLRSSRAGIYPPAFFFPGPVHPIPPDDDGRPRRGNTTQQHDGVAQRPRSHHRAQGVSVNPFGYPPLSDDFTVLRVSPKCQKSNISKTSLK